MVELTGPKMVLLSLHGDNFDDWHKLLLVQCQIKNLLPILQFIPHKTIVKFKTELNDPNSSTINFEANSESNLIDAQGPLSDEDFYNISS